MNTPVSFELAKLLNKHGVIIPSQNMYNRKGTFAYSKAWCICAPTTSEVIMWLYEKHRRWISVYQYKDHAADNNDPFVFRSNATGSKEFDSPTEAYEVAIECVLKMI